MDDKWFKAQQKKAGVTADHIARLRGRSRVNVSHIMTGRQKMSLDWAAAFAEALDLPLATILEKAGVADPPKAQKLVPGYIGSDAVPFIPGAAEVEGTKIIAAAMGCTGNAQKIWRLNTQVMRLAGFLAGDFLCVDAEKAERVKSGDYVISEVYQGNGPPITIFRRVEGPVLVAAGTNEADNRVHVVDGRNVIVTGKVTGSWRLKIG